MIHLVHLPSELSVIVHRTEANCLIVCECRGPRGAKRISVTVTLWETGGLAPKYPAELCVPVADVAGRRQLRSASRELLNFPRYNMSNYGRRAFCFAGPYV